MRQLVSYLLLINFFMACSAESRQDTPPETTEKEQAQEVVDKAIAAHGSQKISGRIIEFDFRGRRYISKRDGGTFQYERIFSDSTNNRYRDVLTNSGLVREINGEQATLSAKDSSAYANSVNSVLYFALLPYYLNDPAVNKTYEGPTEVRGESYHMIRITFGEEGGGKDHEDQFLYWIHADKYTIDYFAYNYQTDGGGARFREAFNVREIAGIRFADYINYKPATASMAIETFDRLLEQDSLIELSRIVLENVQVQPLENFN